jgi:hypothetical protein
MYFSIAYQELQQLQDAGASTEDWQMSTVLVKSKAHLDIQIWQLVLDD